MAILLAWADLTALWTSLRAVPFYAPLATLGIVYMSVPLRVWQWRRLLGMPAEITPFEILRATSIGYLGNVLLPIKGGEFLKIWVLRRRTEAPVTRIVTSLVLQRFQDLPAILVIALVAAMTVGWNGITIPSAESGATIHIERSTLLRLSLMLLAFLIVGLGAIAVYVRASPAVLQRVSRSERLSRISRWLGPLFISLRAALSAGTRRRAYLGAQTAAFACWILFAFAPVPLLLAYDIPPEDVLGTALTITAFTTLAQLIPSAPSSLGTFHALCVAALILRHPTIDKSAALSFALLLHVAGSLGPALLGLPFLQDIALGRKHLGKA